MSFSSIFLHEKKDGATGGRKKSSAVGKYVKQTTWSRRRLYRKENAGKHVKLKIFPRRVSDEQSSQLKRKNKNYAVQVNSLTGPQDFISTSTSAGLDAAPFPSFLTIIVTVPLSPLPVPLWK